MAKAKPQGRLKLLEAWTPSKEAGAPIGCIATSYTFSTELFEEECLSRFLRMETDASEDDILYVIEREEKLAQLKCAAALVDQQHSRGPRSPRWDLIPVRVQNGVMHAKVALLYWQGLVRVVISSANLSPDGYRSNQEVIGILEFHEKSTFPVNCLRETTQFLRKVLASSGAAMASSGSFRRISEFLDRVDQDSSEYGVKGSQEQENESRLYTAFLAPDSKDDILQQLSNTWPGANSRPQNAFVVSPFYDPPDRKNEPAIKLWSLLRLRGEATIDFTVPGMRVESEKQLVLSAPKTLLEAQPTGRSQVETSISAYSELQDSEVRPLHAKSIWMQDQSWVSLLIGSSNFTTPGLGIRKDNARRNFEANLIVQVQVDRNSEGTKQLAETMDQIQTEDVDLDDKGLIWQHVLDLSESDAEEFNLPLFFAVATLKSDEKKSQILEFQFEGKFANSWRVRRAETQDGVEIYSDEKWRAASSPKSVILPWSEKAPPAGFIVDWNGKSAYWPVNIDSQDTLVPPDLLRDLPLETLIQILVSAKPMHEVLRRMLKDRNQLASPTAMENDPHKRIDTSTFLLQRTRRVSWALTALRKRLERPVATVEALKWRIWGPVGVIAIKNAVLREAHSDAEKCFLITELFGELNRVKPTTFQGSISIKDINSELSLIKLDLREEIARLNPSQTIQLQSYITKVIESETYE